MQSPLIGILAGMGPRSTAPFIDLVVTECQVQYGARDDLDFPKMMICSQPAPFYEDRPIDHAALQVAIVEGLQHLERAGADFLAIACNTAHIYYPHLAQAVQVPLLNMVEITVAALPPTARKLALIAAQPTIEAEIYQTALLQRGLTVAEIQWQTAVNELLGAIRTTRDPQLFRTLWTAVLERIAQSGADAVVVACLDLSALLPYATTDLPLLDAAQCLAQAVVKHWRNQQE